MLFLSKAGGCRFRNGRLRHSCKDLLIPPSRHRKKQKAETKDLIISSARNLFEKLGFEKTTMRAVSAEAEMGYGTVFKHFSNKSELLAACLHEAIEKTLIEAFISLPGKVKGRIKLRPLHNSFFRHSGESRIGVRDRRRNPGSI